MKNASDWISDLGTKDWKGKSKGMEVPLAKLAFRKCKKDGWQIHSCCSDGDTKQIDEYLAEYPEGQCYLCQGHVNKNCGKKYAEVVVGSNAKSQYWLTKHQEECEFDESGNP